MERKRSAVDRAGGERRRERKRRSQRRKETRRALEFLGDEKQSADHVGDGGRSVAREQGTRSPCDGQPMRRERRKPIHKARSSAYVDVGSFFILILLLVAVHLVVVSVAAVAAPDGGMIG